MTSSTDQPDSDETREESPRGAYAAGIADDSPTEVQTAEDAPPAEAAPPVDPAPAVEPAPPVAAQEFTSTYVPPDDDDDDGPLAAVSAKSDEHPEYLVGGAFAGGILLALILKSLGRN